MQKVLNISEAYSLALHSLALLASDNGRSLTTHHIASTLGASEAHLSKVMQRLTKAGFLNSSRGPGGGFALKKPAEEITLLDIYSHIEGPLIYDDCLFDTRICGSDHCIFDGLIGDINRQFKNYLENTSLCDIQDVFGGEN
jgi:Rrf2 family protein